MALIVEDGTGVANAQTYADVAALTAYAALRGITTLPSASSDKEILLIKAMDYLESKRTRWKGTRVPVGGPPPVDPGFSSSVYGYGVGFGISYGIPTPIPPPLGLLQWPRYGVDIDGYVLPATTIPKELIEAQCVLAVAAITYDLMPTLGDGPTGAIKREKIGPIEFDYTTPTGTTTQLTVKMADAMLAPLLTSGGYPVGRT